MAQRALLVGINEYANSKFNLRGCVNDMESLAHLLSDVYGFGASDFEFVRNNAATRPTILSRLEAMLSQARSGDTLIFAFSGHGTQARSTDVDEPDSKDECLVPYEASFSSLIKDNELHDLFKRYVDEHIAFTAIFDCCHSGTMVRTLTLDHSGMLVEEIINRYLEIEDLTNYTTKDVSFGPYNVLSACRDDETAADLREAGPDRSPRGAFSYSLHNFLRSARDTPVALADPQIAAGIAAVSTHRQTPSYTLIDDRSPLIRY